MSTVTDINSSRKNEFANTSRLEQVVHSYWRVSTAIRHPDAKALPCQDTIAALNRHKELVHTVRTQRAILSCTELLNNVIEGMPPRKTKGIPTSTVTRLP